MHIPATLLSLLGVAERLLRIGSAIWHALRACLVAGLLLLLLTAAGSCTAVGWGIGKLTGEAGVGASAAVGVVEVVGSPSSPGA